MSAVTGTSDVVSRRRVLDELRAGAERMLTDADIADDPGTRTYAFLAMATANLHLAGDAEGSERESLAERSVAACEQAVAAAARIAKEPAEAARALIGILNASLGGLGPAHRARITPLITEVARLLARETEGGNR